MAKKKIFFGWEIQKAVGAGDDATVQKGGFKQDAAIGPGSYPNPENRITSESQAIAEASAWLRRYQSKGKDHHALVYVGVFGEDAANPVQAFPGDLDEHKVIARIDTVERELRTAVRLANTSKDDGDALGGDDDGIPELGG